MKILKLVYLCLVCIILTSCTISNITWKAHNYVKNVELGMTKQEVIHIMGSKYLLSSKYIDAQKNIVEKLSYKSDVDEEYSMIFINNKLQEWSRVFINKEVFLKKED